MNRIDLSWIEELRNRQDKNEKDKKKSGNYTYADDPSIDQLIRAQAQLTVARRY